jgi:crotonobetainyl-CoA:carnitine CoA-transferase CaiB-like acyl-CoA transferase
MKLGDMGADVIKIEQPGRGDDARGWGPPFVHGESAYFLSVNRNKRSLTLDLKSPQGKDVLRKLLRQCDVLVENFRAGVMESLGFGYRSVQQLNPKMIYCSISGYGQKSSKSHKPTYDLIIQGESGLMDVTGFPDGPPVKAGISLADVTAGMLAFEGILLALFNRERTGRGEYVDISLLDGLLSLFTYQAQIALSTKNGVSRKGNRHPTITPYETYAAKDGWLNVAVGGGAAWKSFCTAVGREKLSDDSRFSTNAERVKHRGALERILVPLMKSRKVAEWIRRLEQADVPAGRINSIPDALRLPLLRERRMITKLPHPAGGTLRMVGSPLSISGSRTGAGSPPPRLGQHTREVLAELGFSGRQIATLGRKGIV